MMNGMRTRRRRRRRRTRRKEEGASLGRSLTIWIRLGAVLRPLGKIPGGHFEQSRILSHLGGYLGLWNHLGPSWKLQPLAKVQGVGVEGGVKLSEGDEGGRDGGSREKKRSGPFGGAGCSCSAGRGCGAASCLLLLAAASCSSTLSATLLLYHHPSILYSFTHLSFHDLC